jgi:tRNA(Ile)-lysidine synthase
MLDRFREHLERKGLVPPGVRLLVGYSGGADSTCLLHLLHLLGVDIVAAHLHHGQRQEADNELKFCEAFANELKVPFASGKADVPRLSQDLKIGLEHAGREARYGFFQQAAFQTGCNLIATAHTMSDNVETVLLNMARGTGLVGIAGIPEKRDNIVRPLMIFTREETRTYCEELAFWFHDDPANQDLTFSRARVRHRIVPELKAINPAAEEAVARLAAIAGDEDRFLDSMAAAALERSERAPNGDLHFLTADVEAVLDRASLATLPPVLFKRSLRLVAAVLGASLNADQTEGLAKGIAIEEKGSITAEGGEVAFEWESDHIHARIVTPTEPFRSSLEIPGEIISEEFGWCLTAEENELRHNKVERMSLETALDLERVKGPLHFRTAKPGDTMQPFGFKGTRKLSDLLSEAKLTKAARARLPIICDMVGCLWAPGVCLDSRAAPDAETRRVVQLRFQAHAESPKS